MYTDGFWMSFGAFLAAALIAIIVALCVVFVIFYFVGMYKLFKKLGKNGWEIFIPFYGKWVFYEAVGLEWYWFLIGTAPLLLTFVGGDLSNLIVTAGVALAELAAIYNVSKKFGKSNGWIVVSFFFQEITLPLLGYSDKEVCDDSVVVSPNAMFGKTTKTTKPTKSTKKASKKD